LPNPQAEVPSLVGCPRLFIQYIPSYPPYLEAVSSIRNPRTRHTLMTTTQLVWLQNFSWKTWREETTRKT